MPGTITFSAEVTNVSAHCFWLLLGDEALAVPFSDFPWLKNATIDQLTDVERPTEDHLYWPQLDVDRKTGLMVCCPMTTKIKGYPFEVLTDVDGTATAVLSDQVKSLDWKVRRAQKKGVVASAVIAEVRAKIKALLVIS